MEFFLHQIRIKTKKLYSIIEIFELVGNDDSIHIQWSKYPNTGEEKTVVK